MLTLTQFKFSTINRKRLWGVERFCKPVGSWHKARVSEEHKKFRAAMYGFDDKTKLFFLFIADTLRRYPCAGSVTDQLSLTLLRDMKVPGEVYNDYGKCSNAMVLLGRLFIPETLL